MMKRVVILLFSLLALFCGVSCTPIEQPTGTVTITFTTGEVETRATTPGDGKPVDGGGIYYTSTSPDLVILIEKNSDHSIVRRYLGTNTEGITASFVEAEKQKRVQVKFTGVPAGAYTVYAIANTNNGTVWLPGTDFSTIDAASLNSLQFTSLAGSAAPSVADRMPLSAKGPLTVQSSGNGSVSLELLRCVAKVSVTFKNATGGTLSLSDIGFSISDMNPKWGYLMPPAGTDSPSAVEDFRSLVITKASLPDDTSFAMPSAYVFPSEAQGGIYYCSTQFHWELTKNEVNSSGDYQNGTYAPEYDPLLPSTYGLRIFDKNFDDVTALGRNQHLQIEIRIGEGTEVSFNFIVGDWIEKTVSVEFN